MLAILSMSGLALADGNSLIVRKRTGPVVVSVFAAESPLRVGTADLSVMVQNGSDESPVMDAKVMLRLTKTSADDVTEVAAPATHAKSSNKTLYSAQMTLPSAGAWRLSAEVNAGGTSANASADLNILPAARPMQTYWPYIALVPLAVLLFAFNRWLRRRRDFIRPRARP